MTAKGRKKKGNGFVYTVMFILQAKFQKTPLFGDENLQINQIDGIYPSHSQQKQKHKTSLS